MSAGAFKQAWKPVARTAVWQFRRTTVASSRHLGTLFTASSKGFVVREGVVDEALLVRPWAILSGSQSASRAAWGSPQVRWTSGGSSALRKEEEEEKEIESVKEGEGATQAKQGDLVKSDYWGVTTKSFVREDGSKWPWNCFRPSDAYYPDVSIDLTKHHVPRNWEEKLALWTVKSLRVPVDLFFMKRYGCRAMMLETVAAVPGMVGGMLLHLRSLRRFEHSGGWIKALLDEAENERMHLMTLMEVVKPEWYERALVVAVQGVFFNAYFLFYLVSPRLAHRFTGYLEEEAIWSYSHFLSQIDNGSVENVPAPAIAIDYWRLKKDARLRDVILSLRADEAHHRDVNHYASDVRSEGKQLYESPAPVDYH